MRINKPIFSMALAVATKDEKDIRQCHVQDFALSFPCDYLDFGADVCDIDLVSSSNGSSFLTD